MGSGVAPDRLATDLLAYLRVRFASPKATFAEAPSRFPTGAENRVFGLRLTGAPSPADDALVLKLFAPDVPGTRARFEAVVQNTLAAMGFPAPRVVDVCESADVIGGPFMVMERLPGAVMLEPLTKRNPGVRRTVSVVPAAIFRMPGAVAAAQARLHALDASVLLRAMEEAALAPDMLSLDRHLTLAEERIDRSRLEGLRAGAAWLRAHMPAEVAPVVICHGDLWFGNLLEERRQTTGVIDWAQDLVAAGNPMYDVGVTNVGLLRGVADLSGPLQPVARAFQRWLSRRYLTAYQRLRPVDMDAVRYFELVRCVDALTWVGERRTGTAGATIREADDVPNMWDLPGSAAGYVAHFLGATGIRLTLPAAP